VFRSAVAAIAAFGAVLPAAAGADTYPSRAVEMIIPFTAGSGLDVNGRTFAAALSEELKQPVVVINREGAGGTIGFGALASATPDGHTIGFGPNTPITTSPYIAKGVRYNAGAFSYICQIFETVFVLAVGPNSKFKSFEDMLTEAKAKPNMLTYGSAGLGTVPHLTMASFGQALGAEFQHVPYRGDGPLLPALLKGDLDLAVVAIATVREQPSIRALVTFSDERQKAYPSTPTAKELGVARSVSPGQVGLFAPKDVPENVRLRLEKACETVNANAAVLRVIETTGQSPKYRTGAQFREATVEDYAFKGSLTKSLKLGID
jgi:tripartite-type tricarboxylate transporter receptor subunit TctC